MREHEKAMEHNDKVLAQQEGGAEGEGAEVCRLPFSCTCGRCIPMSGRPLACTVHPLVSEHQSGMWWFVAG